MEPKSSCSSSSFAASLPNKPNKWAGSLRKRPAATAAIFSQSYGRMRLNMEQQKENISPPQLAKATALKQRKIVNKQPLSPPTTSAGDRYNVIQPNIDCAASAPNELGQRVIVDSNFQKVFKNIYTWLEFNFKKNKAMVLFKTLEICPKKLWAKM